MILYFSCSWFTNNWIQRGRQTSDYWSKVSCSWKTGSGVSAIAARRDKDRTGLCCLWHVSKQLVLSYGTLSNCSLMRLPNNQDAAVWVIKLMRYFCVCSQAGKKKSTKKKIGNLMLQILGSIFWVSKLTPDWCIKLLWI